MICNIIFDVGNVLTIWDAKALCEGIYPNDPRKAKIAYEKGFTNPLWYIGDNGSTTMMELATRMASDSEEVAILQYAFAHFSEHLIPNPQMIEFLKAAHEKGYSCYLLSNYNEYFPSSMEHLGVLPYIDGYVYSHPIRIIKPEIGIFQHLFKKYHLDPKDCLFIDDREPNIDGARKAGIAHLYQYEMGKLGPLELFGFDLH